MSTRANLLARRTVIVIAVALTAFAAGSFAVHAATSHTAKKKPRASRAYVRVRTVTADQLVPGKTIPLKISVANAKKLPLWITALRVAGSVDSAHAAAGCTTARDYRINQLPKSAFPLRVTKKTKSKLKSSAVGDEKKLSITMLALAGQNQDACKGATVKLSVRARISTKKPRRAASSR